MITCFGDGPRMGDDYRILAQKCLATGTSAGDWQAAAIFDAVRRGEGDTGRVSGASGVMQLEKPHSARDLPRTTPALPAVPGASRDERAKPARSLGGRTAHESSRASERSLLSGN